MNNKKSTVSTQWIFCFDKALPGKIKGFIDHIL